MGAPRRGSAIAFVVREAITHALETAKWFFRLDDPDEEVRLRLLRETLERVDWKLIEQARNDPTLAGMGTTLTARAFWAPTGSLFTSAIRGPIYSATASWNN